MEESDKELIGMLIVLAIVMAGVQWLFVRFTHWSAALIATVLITCIITFFYVTLSHATPNGGSNGPGTEAFITPFFVLSALLFCTLWLVCYLSGKQIPNLVIAAPLVVITLFGIGSYTYQYIDAIKLSGRLFSSCRIKIVNETDRAPVLENIGFKCTSSSLVNYVDPDPKERSVFIPRDTDKIIFRYYPDTSETSMEEVFSFDYTLCAEKEYGSFGLVFWVPQKHILPITFILRSENKIDVYINNQFIQHYPLKSRHASGTDK